MRENADAKARRYLVEGRVTITAVDGPRVLAYVRGDGAVWRCEAHGNDWVCNCPAKGRCSHLLAVGLVTAPVRDYRR